MNPLRALPLLVALLAPCSCLSPSEDRDEATLQSVALRVYPPHLEPMQAFYREAFGFEFREVETFGLTSLFGERDGLTLKLVPIREEPDFEGYPSHQLGFEVDDLRAVIDLARELGGRKEGGFHQDGDRLAGAVRDPDGNTIELYERD